MIDNPDGLFPARPAWLVFTRLSSAMAVAAALSAGSVLAAPASPMSAERAHGIHVQRSGDMPKAREDMKMMIDAMKGLCGSAQMKQACLTTLSDPAATSKAKSRCVEMMSPFKLSGTLDSIGETVIDEYFAPGLNRSAKVVKTTVLRQTGVCSAEVGKEERQVTTQYRTNGYTRHERKADMRGNGKWQQFDHAYVPGLASMLKTAVDAALLGRKVTVSPSLGHKTLVPRRACEIRRINAGDVAFSSCIYPTGLAFPSHVAFENEVVASGKTQLVEKFVSYAHDVALPHDLFFPVADAKATPARDARPNPDNPTNRWCAAEKARTGIDPCEGDND